MRRLPRRTGTTDGGRPHRSGSPSESRATGLPRSVSTSTTRTRRQVEEYRKELEARPKGLDGLGLCVQIMA
jgi:hypothetical protein